MAKTRIINTRFWDDTYISNLNPIEKLLFLYFLTNTHTNICGIYELPLKNIAVDSGIEKEEIEKILKKFAKERKISYIEGWVCVINFPKYQAKDNPKIKKGIENEINLIPSHILEKSIAYGYPMHSQSHSNSNLNSNSNSNTSCLISKEKIRELADEFECDTGKIQEKIADIKARGPAIKSFLPYLRKVLQDDFGKRINS